MLLTYTNHSWILLLTWSVTCLISDLHFPLPSLLCSRHITMSASSRKIQASIGTIHRWVTVGVANCLSSCFICYSLSFKRWQFLCDHCVVVKCYGINNEQVLKDKGLYILQITMMIMTDNTKMIQRMTLYLEEDKEYDM